MNIKGNKILITGGGTGIGLGLTERFLKEGNQVIICGRRPDVLQEVKDKFPKVITKVCDLTQHENRVELYNWIAENHGDLNVLVNNAGIQNWMNLEDDDFIFRAQQEIEINALAPIHLMFLFTKLNALDTMINVGSGLAYAPMAKVPVYCATKSFLHSISQSFRHTQKAKGIEVIEIMPPALNTDLGGRGLHDAFPSVAEFIEVIFEKLGNGEIDLSWGAGEPFYKAVGALADSQFEKLNPQ